MPVVPSARSSRARSASPPSPPPGYQPPTALADLHILDLLELAESQGRAAAALAVHQSTVSGSLLLMQRQFRLVPRRKQRVLFGDN
jgi:hypothetical protein